MKLLLDECTPKRLRLDFSGHTVHTVEDAGLKGLKNGELLRIASSKFDVLITVDKNIPFQQHLPNLAIAIVILVARSNRYPELRMLVPKKKRCVVLSQEMLSGLDKRNMHSYVSISAPSHAHMARLSRDAVKQGSTSNETYSCADRR